MAESKGVTMHIYIVVSLTADVPDVPTGKAAIAWIKEKLSARDDLTITGKIVESIEDEET